MRVVSLTPRRKISLTLLFSLLSITLLPALTIGAQGVPLYHAGLVINHGDGRLTYAYVAFAEDEISGVELLRRSGIPLVTIGFGGLGEGVCSLGGTGCGATECRRRVCQGAGKSDPFWHYVRQTESGSGDWRVLSLGASATKVRDGDLDGWSWTGDDPGLPALNLDAVALLAGVDGDAVGAMATGLPTAAVREVVPAGYASRNEPSKSDAWVYGVAAGGLGLIGGTTVYALRRGRRLTRAIPA